MKNSNIYGVTSLVTSILSLVLMLMPYFGLPLGIIALWSSSKQNKIEITGISTAGRIIGILGVVFNSITFMIFIGAMLVAYFMV